MTLKTKLPEPGRETARTKPSGRKTHQQGWMADYVLQPEDKRIRRRHFSHEQIIDLVSNGLPVSEVESFQKILDIPMERLIDILGISKSTYQRRKASDKPLSLEYSDRLMRFARLARIAIEVLESKEAAREWLTSPQYALANTPPLDYARTEPGAREVENLLGRMDQGVYS